VVPNVVEEVDPNAAVAQTVDPNAAVAQAVDPNAAVAQAEDQNVVEEVDLNAAVRLRLVAHLEDHVALDQAKTPTQEESATAVLGEMVVDQLLVQLLLMTEKFIPMPMLLC
jgi:hypothetical protein